MMSRSVLALFSVCTLLSTCLYGAEPYKAIRVSDGGAITGSVILAGSAPTFTPFPITKDDKICRVQRTVDRLAVGKNNGVMNCIVTLEGIARGKPFLPGKKLALEQHHCDYMPHVLVVSPKDELSIVNLDPILHNVHCCEERAGGKTVFNIAQPIKGQRTPVTSMLPSDETMLFANCDAGHPWMSAYIKMAETPYFAVTNAEGAFRLNDVPPGTYSLEVWHEGVRVVKTEMEDGKPKKYIFEDPYTLKQPVTVTGKSTTTVNFSLSLRSDS
jgi:hypothetical protein